MSEITWTPSEIVVALLQMFKDNAAIVADPDLTEEEKIDRLLVPCLLGAPGLAKTAVSSLVARKLGVPFDSLILAQYDIAEVGGYPYREGNIMYRTRPFWMPSEGVGVFLMDEITQCPLSLQNISSQLAREKRIGEHKMAMGWNLIFAGNRKSDKAAANDIPTHLKNRLIMMPVEASLDDWLVWANGSGAIQPEVVGFLRWRPELLHDFNRDAMSFPSPRSWSYASRIVGRYDNPIIEEKLLAGTVGQGAAAEFVGYLRLFRSLPDPDMIFSDPDRAPLPEGQSKAAVSFALVTVLARRVSKKTMPALLRYLDRLPGDYNVICVRDIKARDPKLLECREMIEWAQRYHVLL